MLRVPTESESRSGVIHLHLVALLLYASARRLEVGSVPVHWRTINLNLVEHVKEGYDERTHSVGHGY